MAEWPVENLSSKYQHPIQGYAPVPIQRSESSYVKNEAYENDREYEHGISVIQMGHSSTNNTTVADPHICYYCKESFSRSAFLKKHLRTCHKVPGDITIVRNGTDKISYGGKVTGDGATTLTVSNTTEPENDGIPTVLTEAEQKAKDKKNAKKFICEVCGKGFRLSYYLKEHAIVHSGEKNFSCHICEKKFSRRQQVSNHLRVHTGEKPYQCSVCYRLFSLPHQLRGHLRVHTGERPYICAICGKSFALPGHVKGHLMTHLRKDQRFMDEDNLKLYLRSNTIKQESRMLDSQKRVPKPKVTYNCSYCHKTYNQRWMLKLHERIHTGEKPHVCGDCGKAFRTTTKLSDHRRIHTGEKPYFCKICNRPFARIATVIAHTKTHYKPPRVKKIKELPKEKYQFGCDKCENSYKTERSLKVHMKSHNKKANVCEYCNIKFRSKKKLIDHDCPQDDKPLSELGPERKRKTVKSDGKDKKEASDEDDDKVSIKKEFDGDSDNDFFDDGGTLDDYKDEVEIKKEDEPTVPDPVVASNYLEVKIECVKEEKEGEEKVELKKDVQVTDDVKDEVKDEEPVVSVKETIQENKTDVNATESSAIVSDANKPDDKVVVVVKKRKNGVKKGYFACELCPKAYPYKQTLVSHMRTHTGERPYVCDQCGKCFMYPHRLQDHRRIHTGEKPFGCKICGKYFRRINQLQVHKLTHGEKRFVCDACGRRFSVRASFFLHLKKHEEEAEAEANGETILNSVSSKADYERPPKKRNFTSENDSVDPKADEGGNYICNVCEKIFTVASGLKSHMKIHTKARSHVCDVCNKAFLFSNVLRQHKRVHTGEKPYSCDICYKSFAQTSGLNRHKRSHTGVKPFLCEECGKSFTSAQSRDWHKANHGAVKPYGCADCNYRCNGKSQLNKHVKKHMKVEMNLNWH